MPPYMQGMHISPALKKATEKIRCPRCGLEFSLFQSRAIACAGCKQVAYGCRKARCLRCDFEFPLDGTLVSNSVQERQLASYMNGIVRNYNKSVGKKGNR